MTASKSILLRVTPQEHAEITSRASESGLSLSRFLVSRALGDAPATWATAPRGELAKARAALQAALRALDGAQVQEVEQVVLEAPVPVQEAVAQEPVHEVEEDEVDYDDGDVYTTVSPPPGAPVWIRHVGRVYSAWRGDRVSIRRIRGDVVLAQSALICRPGSIFAALIGSTSLLVGRAHEGAVTWGETLSWRQADRAATLDALQALATRDLCPSAWDEDEGEDEDEVEVEEPQPKAPSANPFDDIDW
ncbi:hypothetical protein L6R46_27210 [Myxococcota bacterium]|nr:hypothetical protein [Myxococcota bacterium]